MALAFETDAGIGTRATLGAIVLETDETLEPELARMTALEGVALYHSRIPMVPAVRPETLTRMLHDLPASVRLLPPGLAFDVIGYGCTSASALLGSGAVAQAVQKVCPNAQVTDPLAAIVAAARALEVRRLAFLSPYVADVAQGMLSALEASGLDIAAFGSFEAADDRVVARISEASVLRAAEEVAGRAACDAVVISCTNLRTLGIVAKIEARLGVPVLSSNTALAWHMLRLAGVRLPGRLLLSAVT